MKINKGATIMEVLVVITIFIFLSVAIGRFQADIFSFNKALQNSFSADEQARKIIRPISDEIRSASVSSLGAYPLAIVGTSSLAFYVDVNGDGLKEYVNYFLSNGDLVRGVIVPFGNPLIYATSSETFKVLVSDLKNNSDIPVFEYFDSSYTGSSTSTPLTQPVSPVDVRLVKINLVVDSDPNRSPAERSVTTQVLIRTLKSNL